MRTNTLLAVAWLATPAARGCARSVEKSSQKGSSSKRWNDSGTKTASSAAAVTADWEKLALNSTTKPTSCCAKGIILGNFTSNELHQKPKLHRF